MPCNLLVGPLAWLVQALLFFLGVGTVTFQWYQEDQRRPFSLFAKNAFSLGVGCVLAHFANLIILQHLVQHDRCAWYMLYYFLDFSIVSPLSLAFYSFCSFWVISVATAKVLFISFFFLALPFLVPVYEFLHTVLSPFQTAELFLAGFFLPAFMNTVQLVLSGRAMQQNYNNKNKN